MKFVRSNKAATGNNLSTRLGDLLVAANLIKEDILAESLQIAERSKTKIGQTLVGLGQIDENKLQAALEIQSLIRSHAINTQFGLRALSLACSTRIPVKEALSQLGWTAPIESTAPENELAILMIKSGVVAATVLETVQKQSIQSNTPLGQCLVLSRTITQTTLCAVLSAQVLIKEQKIRQEQAIEAIQSSLKRHQTLERSLFELGIRNITESGVRIGDLLCAAGLLTDGDKLSALEMSLASKRRIGEVLLELDMISSNTLENALKLQKIVASGYISLQQAANFLKRFQAQQLSAEAVTFAIEGKGKEASRLEQVVDLLIKMNVLSKESVEDAQKSAEKEKKTLGEALLSQCKIDQRYVESAWEAQKLIDDKIITHEQAAQLVLKIYELNLSFEQALQQTLKQSEQSLQNLRLRNTASHTQPHQNPLATSSAKASWLQNLLSKIKKTS